MGRPTSSPWPGCRRHGRCLAASADADARRRLADAGIRLFAARPHYLELALVAAADLREAARIDHTADGPKAAAVDALRSWLGRRDLALTTGLATPAVGFSAVRSPDRPGSDNNGDRDDGPALEQMLVTPVVGADAQPIGWVFLRFNFAALTTTLDRSPRFLGFLVDRRGEYLASPDPNQILKPRGDAPLDAAFADLADRPSTPGMSDSVRLDDLTLPGLAVYSATARLSQRLDRKRFREIRDDLTRTFPGLRSAGATIFWTGSSCDRRPPSRSKRELGTSATASIRRSKPMRRTCARPITPASSPSDWRRRRSGRPGPAAPATAALVRPGPGRGPRGNRARHRRRLLEELRSSAQCWRPLAGGGMLAFAVAHDRVIAADDRVRREGRRRQRGRRRIA